MKIIKIYYFHIYNSYFKDGNDKNDIPSLTAFGIVGCSIAIIFVTILTNLYLRIFNKLPNYFSVVSIFTLILFFLFFKLIYKSKYKKIYKEFKNTKWDKTIFKITSWLVLPLAFVFIGLHAYIYNR